MPARSLGIFTAIATILFGNSLAAQSGTKESELGDSIIVLQCKYKDKRFYQTAFVHQERNGQAYVRGLMDFRSGYPREFPKVDSKEFSELKWSVITKPGSLNSKLHLAKLVCNPSLSGNRFILQLGTSVAPPPLKTGNLQKITEGDAIKVFCLKLPLRDAQTGIQRIESNGIINRLRMDSEGKPFGAAIATETQEHFSIGFAFNHNGELLGQIRRNLRRDNDHRVDQLTSAELTRQRPDVLGDIKDYYILSSSISQFPLVGDVGNPVFYVDTCSIFDHPSSIRVQYEIVDRIPDRSNFRFSSNAKTQLLKRVKQDYWRFIEHGTLEKDGRLIVNRTGTTKLRGAAKVKGNQLWSCTVSIPFEHYVNIEKRKWIAFQFLIHDEDRVTTQHVKNVQLNPQIKGPTSFRTRAFPGSLTNGRTISLETDHRRFKKLEPILLTGPGTRAKAKSIKPTTIRELKRGEFDRLFVAETKIENKVRHCRFNVPAFRDQLSIKFNDDQSRAVYFSQVGEFVELDPETLKPRGSAFKIDLGISDIGWHRDKLFLVTRTEPRIVKFDFLSKSIAAESGFPVRFEKVNNRYQNESPGLALNSSSVVGFVYLGKQLVSFDPVKCQLIDWIQVLGTATNQVRRPAKSKPLFSKDGRHLLVRSGSTIGLIRIEGSDLYLDDQAKFSGHSGRFILPSDQANQWVIGSPYRDRLNRNYSVVALFKDEFFSMKKLRPISFQPLSSTKIVGAFRSGRIMIWSDDRVIFEDHHGQRIHQQKIVDVIGIQYLDQLNQFILWTDQDVHQLQFLSESEIVSANSSIKPVSVKNRSLLTGDSHEIKIGSLVPFDKAFLNESMAPVWSSDERHVFFLKGMKRLLKISTDDWKVISQTDLPDRFQSICVSSNHIVVASEASDQVLVFDTSLNLKKTVLVNNPSLLTGSHLQDRFIVLSNNATPLAKRGVVAISIAQVNKGIVATTYSRPEIKTVNSKGRLGDPVKFTAQQFPRDFRASTMQMSSDGRHLIIRCRKYDSVCAVNDLAIVPRFTKSRSLADQYYLQLDEQKGNFYSKLFQSRDFDRNTFQHIGFESFIDSKTRGFSVKMKSKERPTWVNFCQKSRLLFVGFSKRLKIYDLTGKLTADVDLEPFGFRNQIATIVSPSGRSVLVTDGQQRAIIQIASDWMNQNRAQK